MLFVKQSPCRIAQFFLCFVFAVSFSSCNNFSWLPKDDNTKEEPKSINKDGLIKKYRDDGTLQSEIFYKNNLRDGVSKSYDKEGKLQLQIPYKEGLKNGKAKLFFSNGNLRRETEYSMGKINGTRKTYWSNGSISSSLSYKEGLPANDLQEYMKSGKIKTNEKLEVIGIDNLLTTGEYNIKLKFSRNYKRGDYYLGELKEGKYFDEFSLTKLPEENGYGIMTFRPPPGAFLMQKLSFVGKLKTTRGNILIAQKTFNLAIEANY